MANDFTVDLAAANGKVDYAILTKKEDTFPYTDGKRTSDTPIGTKLTLALQGSRLSSLTVKFDHDPLPSVDDAQIKAACSACKFLFVSIPDCEVKLYPGRSGGLAMTATAKTAELVTPGK